MNAPTLPDDTPQYLSVTTALAMELAAELAAPTEVFARHGFDEDEARKLCADPAFARIVKQAKAEWNADTNVKDRIQLKAQMALEELLIPTFALAKDPRVPPPSRTDAVKLFERLSGVTKSVEEGGSGGPRFILSINVGGDGPKEIQGEVINDGE